MKSKTVFCCSECGNEFPKWSGKCQICGAWNAMTEIHPEKITQKPGTSSADNPAVPINEVSEENEIRFSTGMPEFDRALGGGAVRGSLVLIGGAPGIGKSTLLLQMCGSVAENGKILYVTGEESRRQIKMRSRRLGIANENLYVLAETDLEAALEITEKLEPSVVIIDSVQTLCSANLNSAPGSVGQVKECASAVMRAAKTKNLTAFIIGHVNKEGAIAGPRVLEHMVDCVLYFEGVSSTPNRILRAVKNRFGSTNEIGVFEMAQNGLIQVSNPSEMLLAGRPRDVSGTCVTCVIEGSRPIMAEIQALVTPASGNVPRRNSNGIDYNRVMLMLAVLEKRGGMVLGGCDTYVNVAGGLELDEPAADLATVLAMASSYKDKPIGYDVAAIGEVGLTGELRPASSTGNRLSEIARMGFKYCVLPVRDGEKSNLPETLKLIPVKNVRDAVYAVLSR